MNIKFIRSSVTLDTEWEFEEKTDVLVFGDVEGYRYFQAKVREATNSKNNVHLDIVKQCGNSMQCVILKALDKPSKRPRIKFLERKIFKNDSPEMELIIVGNRDGLQAFSDDFDTIIEDSSSDLGGHHHYDDNFANWIVKRSVALNVREPLAVWKKENFQGFDSYILERQDTYLARHWELMTKDLWPYHEPVAGEYPYSV